MMILQGVGHPVEYLGVWYANDPKKGGYMAYAPVLDLTTLFEVIFLLMVPDVSPFPQASASGQSGSQQNQQCKKIHRTISGLQFSIPQAN